MDRFKGAMGDAAKATSDAAKTTKLKGEIVLIENKIKSHKQKFGVEVYAAMISSDREATERLFNEIKLFVEHQEAEIQTKRMQIMSIKDGGAAPPPGGPPPGPPPGGPPGAPGLPPGWKSARRRPRAAPPLLPPPPPPPRCAARRRRRRRRRRARAPRHSRLSPAAFAEAQSPDGKEYYYHENGETSWSVPMS